MRRLRSGRAVPAVAGNGRQTGEGPSRSAPRHGRIVTSPSVVHPFDLPPVGSAKSSRTPGRVGTCSGHDVVVEPDHRGPSDRAVPGHLVGHHGPAGVVGSPDVGRRSLHRPSTVLARQRDCARRRRAAPPAAGQPRPAPTSARRPATARPSPAPGRWRARRPPPGAGSPVSGAALGRPPTRRPRSSGHLAPVSAAIGTDGRRGRGQRARPRRLPDRRPGPLLTPGHQGDLLGRTAAAGEHRRQHRFRAQQTLHPGERPARPFGRLDGRVAPTTGRTGAPGRRPPPPGSSRSRPTPAVGRAPPCVARSQPSSCQRTRSAMPARVSGPAQRQIRSRCSPASVPALMASRVQARPCVGSPAWNRSADARAANAAASTRSAAGQHSCRRSVPAGWRDGTAGVPPVRRPADGRARRRPNREATSRLGQSRERAERADAQPRSRSTSSAARSRRSARPAPARSGRGLVEVGDRQRGQELPATHPAGRARPPGGRAAAANRPSAMPTWHSTPAPAATWSTVARRRPRAAEVAGRPSGGQAITPGRTTSTPGASYSTAAATGSKSRASRSGSGSNTTSSGHRDWASRRRVPRRMPSARAGGRAGDAPGCRRRRRPGSEPTGPRRRPRPPPASPGTRPPGGRAGGLDRRARTDRDSAAEVDHGPGGSGRSSPGEGWAGGCETAGRRRPAGPDGTAGPWKSAGLCGSGGLCR